MATAKLTSKGRVTIPARVRMSLRLRAGDQVDFVELGDGNFAILRPSQPAQALKGIVPKPAEAVGIEDMNAAIAMSASQHND